MVTRRQTPALALFAGSGGGRFLEPGVAVIDERAAVDRDRRLVPVANRRHEAQRVLDPDRFALVLKRRAVVVEVEIPAEIAADRRHLRVGEAPAVGHPSRRRLSVFPVRDRFFHAERAAGPVRRRLGLEELRIDALVGDRPLDRARRPEHTLGDVPFEGPRAGKVLLEIEERLLVVRPRRTPEIGHLAFRQLRDAHRHEKSKNRGFHGWGCSAGGEHTARKEDRKAGGEEFKAEGTEGWNDEGRRLKGGKAKAERRRRKGEPSNPSTFRPSSIPPSSLPSLNFCRPAFLPCNRQKVI